MQKELSRTQRIWCGDEPEPYIIKRAIDRIEQQEQRIAELEAENRDILQNSVSHTTHAEFVSDYQEQLDEKDAKIAELNDFQNSQCAKLLARNGELERELAAANQLIDTIYRSGGEFVDTHIEAYYTAYSGAREGEGK